jgi:Recombinase
MSAPPHWIAKARSGNAQPCTLMQDLARCGIGSKGGTDFGKGALAYLLRNRIYLGEIRHQGRSYPGEHEPIIDRDLFEAVQTKLTAQAQARRQARAGSGALLIRSHLRVTGAIG